MSRAEMALALCLTVLLAVILLEVTASPGPDAGTAIVAGTAKADGVAAGATAGASDGAALDITARPLFRGDRRPAPADGQGSNAGQAGDLPRLTGILVSSEGRRAIFAPVGQDRAIIAVVGDRVGNWRVQEIVADAVTLSAPEGRRRVEPKFERADTVASAVQLRPPRVDVVSSARRFGDVDRQQGNH